MTPLRQMPLGFTHWCDFLTFRMPTQKPFCRGLDYFMWAFGRISEPRRCYVFQQLNYEFWNGGSVKMSAPLRASPLVCFVLARVMSLDSELPEKIGLNPLFELGRD